MYVHKKKINANKFLKLIKPKNAFNISKCTKNAKKSLKMS